MSEVRVLMAHLRKLGYCSSGVRRFCARHRLDFSKLLNEGLTETELKATGDWMAEKAIEEAKK